jgi:hypothetical protein
VIWLQKIQRGTYCTYHLASLGSFLNIHNKFLLLLFKLRPFTIKLALRFSEGTLVLAQPFGGSDSTPKKSFLLISGRQS